MTARLRRFGITLAFLGSASILPATVAAQPPLYLTQWGSPGSSGGLFTPHDVHYGLAEAKRQQRARVLAEAFARHPERFPNAPPSSRPLATAAWINPPKVPAAAEEVANPMTLESDAVAIGAVRASCDADLEHERPGILLGPFSGFGREESAERAAGGRAARARATLPPARSVSAYRANAVGAKCSGEGAELGGP